MASPPPADPTRVQLEGAWEVLEETQRQQSILLARLASWRWSRLLHDQPALLRQYREQEAPLTEALARAEHHARREHLPERHPLRLLHRAILAQRARLKTRVDHRLTQLGERGDVPLPEGLELLADKLRDWPTRPPREDEVLLLSGTAGAKTLFQWAFICGVPLLLFPVLLLLASLPVPAAAIFLLGLIPTWFALPTPSRFWLTQRRLVWAPFVGETKQFLLHQISDTSRISDPPGTLQLRVEGPGSVTLQDLNDLDLLEALLTLHCGLLLGKDLGAPTYPLAMFPATRRMASSGPDVEADRGMVVMRSDWVAFLPEQGLYPFLSILLEASPKKRPARLTFAVLLEQLVLLPERDFDACLEKATTACGGDLWPATTVSQGPAPSGGYQLTTSWGGPVLTGFPDASLREAISRVLSHWPRR